MNMNFKPENMKYVRLVCFCIGGFVIGVLARFVAEWISAELMYVEWNGGKYYGYHVNGVPDGEGRLEKDGMIYAGYWQSGKMMSGTIESDKYVYEGELNGTKFNGYGVCRYKDGHAYWGYWKDDYKEGLGLLRRSDGTFVFCRFRNGMAQIPEGHNFSVGDRAYGIDVSRHQGAIAWRDLYFSCNGLGGVDGELRPGNGLMQPVLFSIAKSTQGGKLRDSRYESNYSEAKKCGKLCGAYHFLTMNVSGKAQAEFFIQNTVLVKGDFPPVLDLEKNSAEGKTVSDREFASIIPIAKEWIAVVKKHYGVSPIIYTNMNIYRKFIATDTELCKYDLWLASPGKERPRVSNCVLWQFSHHGKANGIMDNDVDINLFNGIYKDLIAYIVAKGIK